MAAVAGDLIVDKPAAKKNGVSRNALTQKNQSQNEANIVAGVQVSGPQPLVSLGKENPNSEPKKGPTKAKAKQASSFEKELKEMQEQLEKLKLEKKQSEENLKQKEELVKKKEGELQKLQKMKPKEKTRKKTPEDDDFDGPRRFRKLSDIYRQLDEAKSEG